jgi:hypothetical protein
MESAITKKKMMIIPVSIAKWPRLANPGRRFSRCVETQEPSQLHNLHSAHYIGLSVIRFFGTVELLIEERVGRIWLELMLLR